jgi:hypothetical protein
LFNHIRQASIDKNPLVILIGFLTKSSNEISGTTRTNVSINTKILITRKKYFKNTGISFDITSLKLSGASIK